jgi:radical SAM superfamily enzyme
MENFKKELTIYAGILEIEDKYLSSSDQFISYVQTYINTVYHVILERAMFDNKLTSNNLLIICSTILENNRSNTYILNCNNCTLTYFAKQRLLKLYLEAIESKEIVLWYGLESKINL